jgi:hypothetical protein
MTAIKKFVSTLLWAAFAFLAIAAPTRDGPLKEITHDRVDATATHDAMASVCTSGMSATKQHPIGYPINNYTMITPHENWASYMVKQEWYGNHFVSGPHVRLQPSPKVVGSFANVWNGSTWPSPIRATRLGPSSASTRAMRLIIATRTLSGMVSYRHPFWHPS